LTSSPKTQHPIPNRDSHREKEAEEGGEVKNCKSKAEAETITRKRRVT
jgi:hypothetical protein